jgi:thiol-disulfide isomerase/thioredoxin/uncharacterized membrane protein YphA (DoxX/SURF4 family)
MGALLLVCRLGLAVVFVTAGIAKLIDRAGTRDAVAEFGVDRRRAGAVAGSLPVLEIAIGVALLPNATARFGALGAALLLVVFTVAITRSLARGQAPDCHCFGQVHSRPVGRGTVVRNVVLFTCAAFVAGASAPWLVAAAAGAVIAALIAFQVWFSEAEASPRDQADAGPPRFGLPRGVPAPDFELDDVDGRRWSLSPLLGDARPLLLVFSAAGCVPCQALLPELADWQQQYRDRLTIALIARGERARNERATRDHGLDLVLLDERGDRAAGPYKAHGTPMAVLIAPDATIASRTVAGVDAIAALVAHATRPVSDTTARIGEPAPALVLKDLAGNQVPLADLYSVPTVALFWRPNCGYCRQMLPLLHAIEERPPAGAPRVVVISGGDAEQLREQAIRSTVLLDPEGQAMRAFEAPGTPMAVLVENGRIATDIHAGAGAVLELITTARAPAAS